MATREQTIEKIRKLLSLANSSNEHEANIANKQAQKLISQFHIDQAEIENTTKVKQEIVSVTVNSGSKSNILWKCRLLGDISKVNNCDFYTQKKESDEKSKSNSEKFASSYTVYLVVGGKANVELVEILFNLILDQVEYFAKEYTPSVVSRQTSKSEKNSFKLGIVTRISQRLKEGKEEVIKEHIALKGASSTALMVIDQERKEIELFVAKNLGKTGVRAEHKVNIKQNAYQAGIQKGDSVILVNRKQLKE